MTGPNRGPAFAPGAPVPGEAYLCQVDAHISCGACCGLYNVADGSREAILSLLARRTEQFAAVPRTVEGILAFKESVESEECSERPFPDFHHCPYIGLIGDGNRRVGCLLHPLAKGNDGVDFRGLSYYGGLACKIYFCPSCRNLSGVYSEIVQEAVDDWHTYGLVVTEWELLRAFFRHVEAGIGRGLNRADVIGRDDCLEAIRGLFNLRIEWPFRASSYPRVANYFFEDRMYPKPSIDYAGIGAAPSRYDDLLQALASEFRSENALHRAESVLSETIDQVTARIRAHQA